MGFLPTAKVRLLGETTKLFPVFNMNLTYPLIGVKVIKLFGGINYFLYLCITLLFLH